MTHTGVVCTVLSDSTRAELAVTKFSLHQKRGGAQGLAINTGNGEIWHRRSGSTHSSADNRTPFMSTHKRRTIEIIAYTSNKSIYWVLVLNRCSNGVV